MKNTFTCLVFVFSSICYTQTIGVQLYKDGFGSITDIAHPPQDARLFVAEQSGKIRILNPNQTVNATPFLTIPSSALSTDFETGLLGLAFHPNYAANGYFYVNYINQAGNGVIARYTGALNVANPVATTIMTIPQTSTPIHKGGCIKFGPDGYLYIAVGDNSFSNNAQDTTNDMGKILRIDVNSGTAQTPNYSIPPGNPYVGIEGNDEIWAIGLRNPWRFSFDPANGNLWIADVGEGTEEEINKVGAATPGINYGWPCYEGLTQNLPNCPVNAGLMIPHASYHQASELCAIAGGQTYHGTLYPAFLGKYFFSDLCSDQIGFVSNSGNAITWSGPLADFGSATTFASNLNGELFIGSFNGKIYRLIDTGLNTSSFNKTSVQLYPNPATSEVYIKSPKIVFPATACVFDVSGKLLNNQLLTNESDAIVTKMLQSGAYLVHITDKSGANFNSKLMIQ